MSESEALSLGSSTLHEAAGQIGALPCLIRPIARGMRVSGPAFPVRCAPGDNLWLHRALAEAEKGAVLVVDVGGHYEAGYWGEIMAVSAQSRGIAGIVIDGCVRDLEGISALGFPVFARGICIRGTTKKPKAKGSIAAPIKIADVTVDPSDLVVGDADGVVVLPGADIGAILERAREREAKERDIVDQLRAGRTTLEVYGLE